MTSRVLFAGPALVLSFVLAAAAASCGSNGITTYPLVDAGFGAGTTSSTHTTSTLTGSSSSGTGGTGTCGGEMACTDPDGDMCPTLSTSCVKYACTNGCCVASNAAMGAPCNDNGGNFCDGMGHCHQCVNVNTCPMSTTVCATAICTAAGACSTTNATKGMTCHDNGGVACDGNGDCVAAGCADGIQDGNETDIDCGGSCPSGCADGKHCATGQDCIDGVCMGTPLTCQVPTCTDGVKNGNETDTDCGGGSYMGAPQCPRCVDNATCLMDSDCIDGSCVSGHCAPHSCSDGVKNGTETDVDCGGGNCMPCADGKMCATGKDCVNQICGGTPIGCSSNCTCNTPTCNDHVKNGLETDIDCGGGGYMGAPACPACNPGEKCTVDADCQGMSCNTTCQCPSGMVIVPIQGSGIYCIDAVEVTNAEYNAFYTANPAIAGQDATTCGWNTSWTPSSDWPFNPTTEPDNPVHYVNWCQANEYCKYNGKRLCGKINPGAGSPSAPQSSFNDSTVDEWFNACSSQGVHCGTCTTKCTGACYPYSGGFNALNCNGGGGGTESFTDLPFCQGGVSSLLNMSGNVAEWEDSCSATTGQNDSCSIRGGSYLDDSDGLRCDSGQTTAQGPITQKRNYQGPDVGFRCCL